MSYHYSKYEFVGPESDLERYRFRSASSSSLRLVCFDGIFRMRGAESDFRRNIRITNYDLLQVHVVIPLATCLRNGYAIPLGYAEFSV